MWQHHQLQTKINTIIFKRNLLSRVLNSLREFETFTSVHDECVFHNNAKLYCINLKMEKCTKTKSKKCWFFLRMKNMLSKHMNILSLYVWLSGISSIYRRRFWFEYGNIFSFMTFFAFDIRGSFVETVFL